MTIFTIFGQPQEKEKNEEKPKKYEPKRDLPPSQECHPNAKGPKSAIYGKTVLIASCVMFVLGIGSTVALEMSLEFYEVSEFPGYNILATSVGLISACVGYAVSRPGSCANERMRKAHAQMSSWTIVLFGFLFVTSIIRATDMIQGMMPEDFTVASSGAASCDLGLALLALINIWAISKSVYVSQEQTLEIDQPQNIHNTVDPSLLMAKLWIVGQLIAPSILLILGIMAMAIQDRSAPPDAWVMDGALAAVPLFGIFTAGIYFATLRRSWRPDISLHRVLCIASIAPFSLLIVCSILNITAARETAYLNKAWWPFILAICCISVIILIGDAIVITKRWFTEKPINTPLTGDLLKIGAPTMAVEYHLADEHVATHDQPVGAATETSQVLELQPQAEMKVLAENHA